MLHKTSRIYEVKSFTEWLGFVINMNVEFLHN